MFIINFKLSIVRGEQTMSRKIGRNEPCPCGSGKKYKRCCGDLKVVSISHLMDEEATQLQMELIDFAVKNYEGALHASFNRLRARIPTVAKEDLELYFFIHTIWFLLHVKLEDGKTILEKFVEVKQKAIRRPRMQAVLQSWSKSEVVVGELVGSENKEIKFTDILRDKTYEAYILDKQDNTENPLIFGFLLPYESKYTFFMTYFSVPASIADRYVSILHKKYEDTEKREPATFLENQFFELFIEWTTSTDAEEESEPVDTDRETVATEESANVETVDSSMETAQTVQSEEKHVVDNSEQAEPYEIATTEDKSTNTETLVNVTEMSSATQKTAEGEKEAEGHYGQAYTWDQPIYEEVALLYEQKMGQQDGVTDAFVNYGIKLWKEFCTRRPKRIKNKALYAAAIHYLVQSEMDTGNNMTQKKLADLYEVSAGSISSIYNEIREEVEHLFEKVVI